MPFALRIAAELIAFSCVLRDPSFSSSRTGNVICSFVNALRISTAFRWAYREAHRPMTSTGKPVARAMRAPKRTRSSVMLLSVAPAYSTAKGLIPPPRITIACAAGVFVRSSGGGVGPSPR